MDYYTATLVFKSTRDMAPKYHMELLTEKKISGLGSHSTNKNKLLTIPNTTRETFASNAFSVYGPTVWNNLPYYIRTPANHNSYKKT